MYESHYIILFFHRKQTLIRGGNTRLVLQYLNSSLSSSRECDVNLTTAVSILCFVVINVGNQTVDRATSDISILMILCKRNDKS